VESLAPPWSRSVYRWASTLSLADLLPVSRASVCPQLLPGATTARGTWMLPTHIEKTLEPALRCVIRYASTASRGPARQYRVWMLLASEPSAPYRFDAWTTENGLMDSALKIIWNTFPDLAAFKKNPQVQDAVVPNIEIIGEAVKINSIAPDFIEQHPKLPWAQMRGMRNLANP
jgi:hypothetical protein